MVSTFILIKAIREFIVQMNFVNIWNFKQSIQFYGVGGRHKNGNVDKVIRKVSDASRDMMINENIYWPYEVNMHLWTLEIC